MPTLFLVPFYFNIAVENQQREHKSLFICEPYINTFDFSKIWSEILLLHDRLDGKVSRI